MIESHHYNFHLLQSYTTSILTMTGRKGSTNLSLMLLMLMAMSRRFGIVDAADHAPSLLGGKSISCGVLLATSSKRHATMLLAMANLLMCRDDLLDVIGLRMLSSVVVWCLRICLVSMRSLDGGRV
jgi:hypothetical protein